MSDTTSGWNRHPLPPPTRSWPPPPSPQPWPTHPSASVASGLSAWLQGLLWTSAAIHLVGAVATLVDLVAFDDFWAAPFGSRAEARAYDRWEAVDIGNSVISLIGLAEWIAVFVLLIVWMNKAHKATQRLWPGPRTWSSGWTVGGWFIPLAQLVIPRLVLTEIERIATVERVGGRVDSRWRYQGTSPLGWWWWLLLVGAIVVSRVADGKLGDTKATQAGMRTGYVMWASASAGWAISSGFGAVYVRRLSHRLSPTGITASP